jgi:hypothetical protein
MVFSRTAFCSSHSGGNLLVRCIFRFFVGKFIMETQSGNQDEEVSFLWSSLKRVLWKNSHLLKEGQQNHPFDFFFDILKKNSVPVESNEVQLSIVDSYKKAFSAIKGVALEWQNYFLHKKRNDEVSETLKDTLAVFATADIRKFVVHKILYCRVADYRKIMEIYKIDIVLFASLLTRLASKGDISFPLKKCFLTDPSYFFENLKQYHPKLLQTKFFPQNCRFQSGRFFDFRFQGEYLLLETQPEDYNNIDCVCDIFNEIPRLKAIRKDQQLSALDWWTEGTGANLVFSSILAEERELSPYEMREKVFHLTKECTQFKPTLAFTIFREFRAHRVLDFSAGWGDRLIAALAAGVDSYVGVDPNFELEPGHSAIIKQFSVKKNQAQIIYQPFQSCEDDRITNPPLPFDLVFTSPPFFDFEIYTKQPTQSAIHFPELTDWLVEFLFVSLRKAWEVLAEGGHLALHLTDVYKTHVCEPTNLWMQIYLPFSNYCGIFGTQGSSKKVFPIWVWKKQRPKIPKEEEAANQRKEQAAQYLKDFFPEISERVEMKMGKKRTEESDNTHASKKLKIGL